MFNIGDIVQYKDVGTFGDAVYKVIGTEDSEDGVILIIYDIEDEDNLRNGNGYYAWKFRSLRRKEEYLNET